MSVSNSVENKQLFYAIDKVYYILISFLTMNCKLTNLIFVFFRSIDLFSFFFQTTNCWLAIPGVVLVGVRVRAFPSTPGAGCSRLRDSYPPSPTPTTLWPRPRASTHCQVGEVCPHLTSNIPVSKYTCLNNYTNIESFITNLCKYVIILKMFLAIFEKNI